MNPDKRDLKLMLEHFRTTKEYEKALAAFNATKDLRNRRQAALTARSNEWSGQKPADQQHIIAQIVKEIEEEVN